VSGNFQELKQGVKASVGSNEGGGTGGESDTGGGGG